MTAERAPREEVLVVAHRGASADRPENTLAAFDEALRQGCDAIELDVQLSADGIPVVYHDDTLDRLGRPGVRPADLDLDELQRLDAGAPFGAPGEGHSIPTLETVLEGYTERLPLLVELKAGQRETRDGELARATVERIRRAGAVEEVFILSFDPGLLRAAAEAEPRLRLVLNLRPLPVLGPGLRSRLAELAALCVDIRYLTPAFARGVLRAGTPLWTYTCNEPAQVDSALDAGAAAIVSDRPGWLAAYLGRGGES